MPPGPTQPRRGVESGCELGSIPRPGSVTIITVACNSEKTIRQTCESIHRQRGVDYRHILIDGGSQDRTVAIAADCGVANQTIISESDDGLYDAMNKGLALANSQYVHFLNSDDHYMHDDSLSRVVHAAKPDALNYAILNRETLEGIIRRRARVRKSWNLHVGNKIYQPVTLYPLSLLRQVGGFDTTLKIAADYDVLMRSLAVSEPHFIDVEFVFMAKGGLSQTELRESFREFREVSVRHGCPPSIAAAIERWKIMKMHFKRGLRRFRLLDRPA